MMVESWRFPELLKTLIMFIIHQIKVPTSSTLSVQEQASAYQLQHRNEMRLLLFNIVYQFIVLQELFEEIYPLFCLRDGMG